MNIKITFFYLSMLACMANVILADKPMRLYTFYTDSHMVLKDQWFLPSLYATKDNLDIIVKRFEQECASAAYLGAGWNKTMLHKVEMILEAIEDNWDKVFVYADVDIQFFKPIKNIIEKEIIGYDMLIQKDRPDGFVCAGFFACRANEKTKKLWTRIAEYMKNHPGADDQDPLNMMMSQIAWKHFSADFFAGGTLTGKRWMPGNSLPVPSTIVLHHANWTVGVENKIEQLKYVREIVKNNRFSEGQ